LRLFKRDARLQSGDRAIEFDGTPVARPDLRPRLQQPDFRFPRVREAEARRQHADDGERTSRRPAGREGKCPADDGWIAAKVALPQGVAENDQIAGTGGLVGRREHAAELCCDAQQIEEVGRDERASKPLGAIRQHDVELRVEIGRRELQRRDVLEHVSRLIVARPSPLSTSSPSASSRTG